MINPLVFWGAGAALLAGLFAGWSVRDWKADADALAAYERTDQLREEMQAKVDAASGGFEAWRASQGERVLETRNTIREIYRNVEVPAECAAAPDAVSLLGARVAAANAAAAGEPRPAVPKTAARAASAD